MKRKDKKTEEANERQMARELLKNRRRQETNLERSSPSKLSHPKILIVCEGKNTEPSYFEQFRLSSAEIIPIGAGCETIRVVEEAQKRSNKNKYKQVWCVFDADPKLDNPNQATNFNNAITLAEKYKFKVAYSNQAFEYWIILHFEDHQGGGMHRDDYHDKINEYLKPYKLEYDKQSKKITKGIFDLLDGQDSNTKKIRCALAIARAKKNYNRFDHTNPAKEESSTTVFKLVEELMKYK